MEVLPVKFGAFRSAERAFEYIGVRMYVTSKGHPLGTPERAIDLVAFSFFLEVDCDRFLLGVGILDSCQHDEDGNSSELNPASADRSSQQEKQLGAKVENCETLPVGYAETLLKARPCSFL